MQAVELLLVIHAADQGCHLQVGMASQVLGVLGDLHDQFTRGGDHQCPRLADKALTLNGVAQQVVEDSYQESGGLAGTGLGLAYRVIALQGQWQNGGLDRRTVLEADIGDAVHQLLAQAQIVKPGLALFGFDLKLVDRPGLAVRFHLAAAPSALVAVATDLPAGIAITTVRRGGRFV